MKTMANISDPVLEEARNQAPRDGTTLRALIEHGLRTVIEETKNQPPFKLRDARFRGEGLQPEYENASWDEIREACERPFKP